MGIKVYVFQIQEGKHTSYS